ncbi:MAG: Asp-tRNA(Asn)/Glu-tRNA(Gln) amidotransferase subunit GatB [Planctomycetes bacterium]|nr:Asp-tRNA(Asn)/Glu-tRNA(Gln) amidotransferase subunit GatB [Planctomycetota bacterium]
MPSATIQSVQLKVGLEIHVELATRTKMFTRAPSPGYADFDTAAPNTLIDPLVLALPGALPVMNRDAIEMSMLVGLALGCDIAKVTSWDRKNYFYPDMPKAYQISQYDRPICGTGVFDLPAAASGGEPDFDAPSTPIRITRAHLEEDAGKLLHESPGGFAIDHSIVDLNRTGTPLLEIVTEPDFQTADQVVLFCRVLRTLCRSLGVTLGVMQRGHMRFEPNINCILTLSDGTTVATPVVEVKNLNSFRSVRGAIEFELADQPRRWQEDGKVMGRGMKITRGWDDKANRTFIQREKEDAHDYRYFPDPDLLPLTIEREWVSEVRLRLTESPLNRTRRYMKDLGLAAKEALALAEEHPVTQFHDAAVAHAITLGLAPDRAGRLTANFILQNGQKRVNERNTTLAARDSGAAPILVSDLGISASQVGELAALRDKGLINSNAADELFGLCCAPENQTASVEALARAQGLIIEQDAGALQGWIETVIAANPKVADDVRAGKLQAAGRLMGEVMKLAAGKADAKNVRELLLKTLGQG